MLKRFLATVAPSVAFVVSLVSPCLAQAVSATCRLVDVAVFSEYVHRVSTQGEK